MNGGGGFHAVIITRYVAEILLTFDAIGPYDWICGQYLHDTVDCYAIYPAVINQISGYSFVENSSLVKPSRYDK